MSELVCYQYLGSLRSTAICEYFRIMLGIKILGDADTRTHIGLRILLLIGTMTNSIVNYRHAVIETPANPRSLTVYGTIWRVELKRIILCAHLMNL